MSGKQKNLGVKRRKRFLLGFRGCVKSVLHISGWAARWSGVGGGCILCEGRRSRCIHTHTHRLGVVNGIFAQRLSRFPCCGSHGVWLVFSSHHRPLCTLGATKTAARAHSVQRSLPHTSRTDQLLILPEVQEEAFFRLFRTRAPDFCPPHKFPTLTRGCGD